MSSAMGERLDEQQIDVIVSEVGPRDGLQSLHRTMPTEAKVRWIEALAAAGLREIEVGSFVSPKLLPQMADAAEVVAAATKIAGLKVLALAPNLKGAERALASGVHVISMPVSAAVVVVPPAVLLPSAMDAVVKLAVMPNPELLMAWIKPLAVLA